VLNLEAATAKSSITLAGANLQWRRPSLSLVNNILQIATTTSVGVGVVRFGGNVVMHQFGAINNIFVGTGAGNFTLSGANNTGLGYLALSGLTSGASNVAVGYQALVSNQVGGNNVALGTLALQLSTGDANIGIGRGAGSNLTAGTNNIAIGHTVQFPSATASGHLNIQGIIFGFGNLGAGLLRGSAPSVKPKGRGAAKPAGPNPLAVSTGRIAIGTNVDDGVSRLQIAGDTRITGQLTFDGTTGADTRITFSGGSGAPTRQATFNFSASTDALGYWTFQRRSAAGAFEAVWFGIKLTDGAWNFAGNGTISGSIAVTGASTFAATLGVTGIGTFGGVAISAAGVLDLGSATRQMIGLYSGASGQGYGIGVQANTQYYRSAYGFAWFAAGIHSNTQNDPGAGGTKLMDLSGAGNLTILGNIAAATSRRVVGFTDGNIGAARTRRARRSAA
jgi:hypothetical protein